ncbi:MAG: cation-translocating P-type ATPase [Tissierellia bacterium]|nr:cation-translocating P-type ATPase [Tissierellia bacterium]
MKKISELFSGLKATIISGIFLILSLIILLIGTKTKIDPAWITIIISGFPLLYSAITRLIYQKWISSALLISIAMLASIAIGEIFAAGEVAFIMAIGGILEEKTIERAKKGITELASIVPQIARRVGDSVDSEEEIKIKDIRLNDILRVLPGENIPVDGEIVSGDSSVDQSIMTGESMPVDKSIGDKVFCGTLNCYGSIDMRATAVGKDTSLEKLINMVKDAENKKAPTQRIADKWAVWLVPIALGIAILTFIVNYLLKIGTMPALTRAVTVLVVFCPCALALATPTAIVAAIGQATKHGIIIKSGEALEKMGRANIIAFDKTGTLTKGKPVVSDIITIAKDYDKENLLSMAASIEKKSEHPLGKAIVEFAKDKNLKLIEVEEFKMTVGRGVEAKIDGEKVYCGNKKYMEENNISSEELNSKIQSLNSQGKAIVLVGKSNRCIGIIALSDILKEDSIRTIRELNNIDTKTILLTGDNKEAAGYLAGNIGIEEYKAELLPSQKVDMISKYQQNGELVCMVGDGVNDAPALKTADVGIAMGSIGSDIAIESSDIALMSDDILKLPYLKRLSNATVKSIKTNIILSMMINLVAIVLSVIGILNPITGAIVHNAGSVLVVLNAAMLYDRKFI